MFELNSCARIPIGIITFFMSLAMVNPGYTAPVSHIGRDQKVLVICVKFSNLQATRIPSCQSWADLLNMQVTPFYERAD